jgi:hypothetical protein
MKSILEPFAVVRIKRLLLAATEYNSWGVNQRPPEIGDSGTLIDVLHVAGVEDRYVVECSGPDGIDIWLADFVAEELEIVESPQA